MRLTAADTLDRALKAANPGDTIRIDPDTYVGQVITYDAGKDAATKHVIVEAGGVTINGLILKGVQWVEIRGLTIRGNFKVTLSTDNQNVPTAKQSHDLVFHGIDCQVFLWRNVENVVLRDSSVGGQNVSTSGLSVPKIGAYVAEDGAPARLSKNVLIERTRFHDIIRTITGTTHAEGFYFDAGCDGITLRDCQFVNCGVFDIFSNGQAAGRPITNILIEGCLLDIPRDQNGGPAASAINFKGGAGKVTLRGNSIGGNIRRDTAAYDWTSEKNAIAGSGGSPADVMLLPDPGFVRYSTAVCPGWPAAPCYENDLHVQPGSPAHTAGAGVLVDGPPDPPDPEPVPDPVAPMLRLEEFTEDTVIVAWDVLERVTEYRFWKDGVRVSNTKDPGRVSVRFGTADYRSYLLGVEAVYPNGTALASVTVRPVWIKAE